MGTRGTYGVRIDGTDKLVYNGFDSYPGGLGADIVREIRAMLGDWGIDGLRGKARNLRSVQGQECPTPEEAAALRARTDKRPAHNEPWRSILRDEQGSLLANLKTGVICGANSFILDSLFCEYGYIVDLDKMRFEVYEGFQKSPHDRGPYADHVPSDKDPLKYYPCALAFSFPLDRIPDNWAALAFPRHAQDEDAQDEDGQDEVVVAEDGAAAP